MQSARDANREAEAALQEQIELDPQDRFPTPIWRSSISTRVVSRRQSAEIDKALAADPSFDIALVARGRYYLQTGEM